MNVQAPKSRGFFIGLFIYKKEHSPFAIKDSVLEKYVLHQFNKYQKQYDIDRGKSSYDYRHQEYIKMISAFKTWFWKTNPDIEKRFRFTDTDSGNTPSRQ